MRYIIYCLSLFLPFYAHSQDTTRVVKNIKTDFGAFGDGIHNDHEAFKEASAFFNERKGHGTLIIPSGTYIVGRQLDYGTLVPIMYRPFAEESVTNPYFKLGLPVLLISGCKNLFIEGHGATVIKFTDRMLFGGFYADGKPMPLKDKQGKVLVPAQNSIALIGDGIYIENSKNITITGIELDGNSPEHLVGGNISADGWQWGQSGILLNDVTDCKLGNLNVHHFAVDGLQLRNATGSDIDKIESQHIAIQNCQFDYNGRQGFSWTGGAGVTAKDCSFSHTGMAYNRSLKDNLSTSPGAGLDIEPESDPNVNIYRMVKKGVFENCSFNNNRGAAMVADLYNEAESRVAEDVLFDDCTFWAANSWSVWVTHPGFVFNNCRIYGAAVHSYAGNKPGKETKFIGCYFEDRAFVDHKGKFVKLSGNYLVEIADGIRTTFDKCTFTSHKKYYYYLTCSDPKNEKSKFIVHNCKFLNASGTDKPKNCIAEGVLFTGKNDYIDFPAK
jgi:hypothetical protein